MAGMDAVSRLLERNKELISRELESTKILGILVKKGVLSPDEEQAVCCQSDVNVRCEVFVKVLAQKGLTAFRELCYALEKECPHVLTSLLVDTEGNNATVKQSTPAQSTPPTELQHELGEGGESVQGQQGGSGSSSSLSLSSAAAPATEDDDDDLPPPPPSSVNEMSLQSPVGAPPPGLHVLPVTQEAQVRRGLTLQQQSPPPPASPPPQKLAIQSPTQHLAVQSPTQHLAIQSPTQHLAIQSPTQHLAIQSPPLLNFNSEMLEEPVVEELSGERISWEYHTVTLSRVPGYGFGIAVSGGRDNPHFANGDPAIAISDVLKAGPAEGRLQVNDRILSANGVSLENVDYATAVQVLRDSGHTVQLVVKRRVVLLSSPLGGAAGVVAPSTASLLAGQQSVAGLPQPEQPQTLRVSLARGKKKDDFGLVLGCRLYIREAGARCREAGLREGDALLSINALPTDNMTLKEAKKLMDQSKERLNLVVRRDPPQPGSSGSTLGLSGGASSLTRLQQPDTVLHKHGNAPSHSNANLLEPRGGTAGYSAQNLYVQPPTRGSGYSAADPDKSSNLAPRTTPGRSRGPLMDVSLSQLDRPATPATDLDGTGPPPRPALPRPEDYYSSRRQLYDDDPLVQRNKLPMPDPRFITFQKEGSVGIRLTGGNEAGIFVTAVQPGSPASLQGLQPGDKILKVNDVDVKGMTREEAVLLLLSLQDQIDLIVQFRRDEYDQVVASQRGDSFHIKTHFNYDQPSKGEMSFRKGDVFHVVDTLYNGVVGSWQVYRIGRNNQEVQKGIVPNKARAEELAAAQLSASKKELTASESRGSFFKRRRGSHRRSKSLSRDHWDDVVFADSLNKFPAYERVVLRHPGFVRPVVLFGPVADVARDKLLRDFPDKFTSPQIEGNTEGSSEKGSGAKSGIIRLSAIREMVERGKHGLLDITPNAVDRLNYAQFYPMVVFLRAENKQVVKELRAGTAKGVHKSSKKLLEQSQKLEKLWSHVFTGTITLTSGSDAWYRKLREMLETQQSQPVWISETKPEEALSDDFLFPMTSRLSYASSPESDLDLSPEPRTSAGNTAVPSAGHVLHQHLIMSGGGVAGGTGNSSSRLVRSTSDPSIATQEELGVIPNYSGPPPYMPPYKQSHEGHPQRHHGQQQQQQQGNPADMQSPAAQQHNSGKRRSQQQQQGDNKYGFSNNSQDEYGQQNGHHHHFHPPPSAHTHHPPSAHHHHPHPPAYRGAEPRSPLTHSPPPPHRPQPGEQGEFPPPPHRQGDPPELPPRVDRSNKPPGVRGHSGTPGSRSAQQERLFGETNDANYMNAGTHAQHLRGSSSLERSAQHPSALKTQSSYDSVSSYDSFNRLGPNAHDDLKSSNNGGSPQPPTSPRNHDPYRFTRSTAQPIKANDRSPVSKAPEFPPTKYRSDYKPSPLPKGAPGMPSSPSHSHQPPPAPYKPVPPPKPKNYRPPNQQHGSDLYWAREEQHISYQQHQASSATSGYYHARSYSVGESIATSQGQPQQPQGPVGNGGVPLMNGRGDGEDSGHGSSLDRNYSSSSYQYHHASPSSHHAHHASPSKSRGSGSNASQYYYNVPASNSGGQQRLTNGHHREASSGLDLANREQRGSAFELYRKPADPRSPPAYIEHGMRISEDQGFELVAAARGWFDHRGGILEDAGVTLSIPQGAIPKGQRHEIFFQVCHSDDPNLIPPLDEGEELLSPLVMCGPHGLRFLVPVELKLPAVPSLAESAPSPEERWSLQLRAGDVADNLHWLERSSFGAVPRRRGTHISVVVDHF